MFFSNRSFKWVRASARNLGAGLCPLGAFGRAAASPQTRQMRCWLSAAQAAYHSFPSLPPTKTRSLRCTAFFPPKPLRWVSAGTLLGAVIKTPISHFFGTSMWEGYHYPPAALSVSEQPRAGFISAGKTAFSEWVLCADECAVPSCTQRFFGTSVWGVVSLPSDRCGCVEITPRGVYFSRKNGFLRVGALRRWMRCSLLHTVLFGHFCVGGGITTLGARFMLLKRWTPAGHGGVFTVFMPSRNLPCAG